MRIPKPFIPVRVHSENLSHTVEVVGKSYTFGPDGMISSIVAEGKELLAEPMRLVMIEDGEEANFDTDYENNESESFIYSRSDEKAIICGCRQSERFIVDFCNTVEYDGNINIDFKLMTRGKTVAQVFGIEDITPIKFRLDRLWLEVPLKKEHISLYHMYENDKMYFEDGSIAEKHLTSGSGELPDKNFSLSFKPLLWLGNEKLGLGYFSETECNTQPESENKAIEIVHCDDKIILRIRLLDSHPVSWSGDYEQGNYLYTPIEFNFGFQATPVKPFPKNPYIHKAFHIDCGIKIKGNYKDFFSAENRFDLLREKGVDTLILHEKWNKCQNWFELSEYTASQLRYICDECHKRGIKVLPYFGYELSTMSPMWSTLRDKVTIKKEDKVIEGGWWRVPFQRDYTVCYNSEYSHMLAEGIGRLMDEYNFDGIYIDSMAMPRKCCNADHECGKYGADGKLYSAYTVNAVRNMFKMLHKEVNSRGGVINVHTFGAMNFTAMAFFDQNWYGENLQFELNKGSTNDVNLAHFRAEYTGRNMGVPVEFIIYENRPYWTFENGLACSLLHGILPRPNDIGHPLELMSEVWKIFDSFPIEKSDWMPYWSNEVKTTNEKLKVSYYRYTTPSGKTNLLAFAVNISAQSIENVTIDFEEKVDLVTDMTSKESAELTFNMDPYAYKIFYIE